MTTGKHTTIARPYEKAAFEYAVANNDIPAWEQMLKAAADMVENPLGAAVIHNPSLQRHQLVELFQDLLKPYLDEPKRNFITLLAQNARLNALPGIYELFKADREAREKVISVEVTSAVQLDKTYQDKLSKALTKRLQRNVELQLSVNPSILGGAIVRAGDLVIDGSVRGKLTRLLESI